MAETIKVSVVVPVYNSAQYLRQCLDSIVGQTMRDIEIICVDDGSTDGSSEILEEYASRDDRFRVLHQENQYAGVARNKGTDLARGEYIFFCDSDDYISSNALKKMYERSKAHDADVCVCGGKRYFQQLDITVWSNYLNMRKVPRSVPFDRRTSSGQIFDFTSIMIHNKMYKLDFLRDNDIRFGDTRNGNDIVFSALTLWKAQRITVVNRNLVVYRIDRPDSLVGTLSKAPLDIFRSWQYVWDVISADPDFDANALDLKFSQVILHAFRHIDSPEAMRESFDYVRDVFLPYVSLTPERAECLPEKYHELIRHLWDDSYDQFVVYLLFVTSRDLECELAQKLSMLKRLARSMIGASKGE